MTDPDAYEAELRRRVAAEIERRRDSITEEVAAAADQAEVERVLHRHFDEAFEDALTRQLRARQRPDPRDP